MDARTELAHQDVARAHGLAAENFNAPSLSLAVAPVARAAAGLLVCHCSTPRLWFDCGDFQRGLILPVTPLPAVALPAFFLEDDDFLGAALVDDLAGHFRIGHQRRADLGIAVAA